MGYPNIPFGSSEPDPNQLGGDLDCNGYAISNPADPVDEHGVGDRGFNDGRYPTKTDLIPPAPVAFAGVSGYTITHNYGHTNYQLIINPVADPGGFLGEIWFAKSNNTVVVYNSGIASGNFDYVLIPDS